MSFIAKTDSEQTKSYIYELFKRMVIVLKSSSNVTRALLLAESDEFSYFFYLFDAFVILKI